MPRLDHEEHNLACDRAESYATLGDGYEVRRIRIHAGRELLEGLGRLEKACAAALCEEAPDRIMAYQAELLAHIDQVRRLHAFLYVVQKMAY